MKPIITPAARTMTPTANARPAPAAFTLAEVIVSLVITSVLVGGIVLAMGIGVRAVDNGTSPTARTAQAAEAVSRLATELSVALAVPAHSLHSIQFTVPDQTGDSLPETIIYAWSGTTGDPVTRVINGGTPANVIDGADGFDLSYVTKPVTSRTTNTVVNTATDVPVASFNTWLGLVPTLRAYYPTPTSWISEYFKIPAGTIPVGATNARISRVSLMLRRYASGGPTFTVAIHPPSAPGGPNPAVTPIGTPATLTNASLPAAYAWTDALFSDAVITSATTEAVIVVKGTGTGGADVQYYFSTLAPVDSNVMKWTTNSGSTWRPGASLLAQQDMRFNVYASYQTSTSSEVLTTHNYLQTVKIAVRLTSERGQPVQTSAQVLNTPEITLP